MADEQLLIGKWRVRFQRWTWEYSFGPDGTVIWRDIFNNETGPGRWLKQGQLINISWKNSTTRESWQCPIKPVGQSGWIAASYATGSSIADKVVAAPVPMGDGEYTGDEKPIDLPAGSPPEDFIAYQPAPVGVRAGSKPIFDAEVGAVIGFMYSNSGYYEFYDLTGRRVATDEIGLEEPLIDPIDFVWVVGGLARGLGRSLIRLGIRAAASAGSKVLIRALTSAVIGGMRATFRAATSAKALKFTATTSARMATKGRYVPTHMLKMAIRYGVREPDPRGVKGAFQYTLQMIRSEPNIAPGLNPAASWAGRKYTLKVVIKEELTHNVVYHFHYQ